MIRLPGGSYLCKGECGEGIYGACHICRIFGFCLASDRTGTGYDQEGLGKTFRPYSDNER